MLPAISVYLCLCFLDLSYGEMAQELCGGTFDDIFPFLGDFNDTTMPADDVVHQLRKDVLYARNLIDMLKRLMHLYQTAPICGTIFVR